MKHKIDFINKIKENFKTRFTEHGIKEEHRNKIIEFTKEWCNLDFIEEVPYIDEYVIDKTGLQSHIVYIIINNYFYDMFFQDIK